MSFFGRKPPKMPTFKKGDRGYCRTGQFTFLALTDSTPYIMAHGEVGRYISMVILDERRGTFLWMGGFPSYHLEKIE